MLITVSDLVSMNVQLLSISVTWGFSSNSGLTHTSVPFSNVAGGHRWIALIFRINYCFPYLSSHCHMTWYCPWRWCLCVFLSFSIRPSCASCSRCWGDSLVAVVWNAARKGLGPRSEFRLQHGLSWMWYIFYPFVNNCHSGYIWKSRLFFNTLNVFIVKTCYECVVLGISFCVNKASRSMHEVLSLQTVSGLLS